MFYWRLFLSSVCISDRIFSMFLWKSCRLIWLAFSFRIVSITHFWYWNCLKLSLTKLEKKEFVFWRLSICFKFWFWRQILVKSLLQNMNDLIWCSFIFSRISYYSNQFIKAKGLLGMSFGFWKFLYFIGLWLLRLYKFKEFCSILRLTFFPWKKLFIELLFIESSKELIFLIRNY